MSKVQIVPSCRHDVGDIAALAENRLPDMPYLHDSAGWIERARFGPGRHPRDKFSLVARETDSDTILGFFWVDDALASDYGFADPWWCINAIAVHPQVEKRGLGRTLVNIIVSQAKGVGVSALYGLCYPQVTDFWRKLGFTVGELEQPIRSTSPVTAFAGQQVQLNMSCEPDHHFFFMNLDEDATPLVELEEA